MFEGGEKRQKTLNKSRNTTFVMNVYLVLILKSKKKWQPYWKSIWLYIVLYCASDRGRCMRTHTNPIRFEWKAPTLKSLFDSLIVLKWFFVFPIVCKRWTDMRWIRWGVPWKSIQNYFILPLLVNNFPDLFPFFYVKCSRLVWPFLSA